MKKIWICLLWCVSSLALADTARVQLYVFSTVLPLVGVHVEADGVYLGRTDENGAIAFRLQPGKHRLRLRHRDKTVTILERVFHADEDVEIRVALHSDLQPQVSVESSLPRLAPTSSGKTPEGALVQVEGTVLGRDGKPIEKAQIFVSGIPKPVASDGKGRFRLKLPPGRYNVSIHAPGYNLLIKEGVMVTEAGKNEPLVFTLTPAGFELPPLVVIEPHLEGSIASAMAEERNAAEVSEILGAEQIARAGDSDVAQAIKRVAGLTIVGGKYVYIRGLGERYANILINGLSIPSPDPTRRVIPVDLFPTTMIESIKVQKGFIPFMPGEFSGGLVDIRTRRSPKKFSLQVSGKIGFNTEATFAKGLRYPGGDYDWIGVDDGTREMPKSLAKALAGGAQLRPKTPFAPDGFTQEEVERFGEQLAGVWDIRPETLPPNGRVQALLGDRHRWGDLELGFVALGRWGQSWKNYDEILRSFVPTASGKLALESDLKGKRTERSVKTNAYLNVDASWRKDHKIFGRVMLVRQTTDFVRRTQGFSNTEGFQLQRTRLWWVENELLDWQVGTEQRFSRLGGLGVHFLYSVANANRYAPNERLYRYDENPVTGRLEFSNKADNNMIIFSNLDDEDRSFRVDVDLPFKFWQARVEGKVAGGYWSTKKNRDSTIRRFRYIGFVTDPDLLARPLEQILTPENIGPGKFVLSEMTRATDNYIATQDLQAYYGQGDVTLFKRFRLIGGVRVEDNLQQVTTFQLFNPAASPIVSTLEGQDVLPAAAFVWMISDKQQLRFGWSQTLSRPDFRELSPAPFTDPQTLQETVGNPDLQPAEVESYDARWEYYFSPEENLSFGIFWKTLTNPIEKVLLPGPAGLLQLQNAGNAKVYGLELDFRKFLGFLHPRLEHVFIGGNYTLSKSVLKLLPENLQTLTNPKRPLQGHSKHILNFRVGYDDPDLGTQLTLLYNFPSRRISQVGALGAPDIYEEPFHQLDFVARQSIGEHWSVQLRLGNLLDSAVRFTQGEETVWLYRKGRDVSLTVNFKL